MASHTKLNLSDLQPGIILPAAIFDGGNSQLLLLGKGTRITAQNLQRLSDRGISSFFIDSSVSHVLGRGETRAAKPKPDANRNAATVRAPLMSRISKPLQTAYSPDTTRKIEARSKDQTEKLGKVYKSLQGHEKVHGAAVKSISVDSVEDMVIDMDLYVKLAIHPKANEPLHQHCLRVSQLAMSIATVMGFSQDDVINLGIGCLISRAGINETIGDLMLSNRRLSEIEMLEVRKIPTRTFALLEAVPDIPFIAKQVAFQIFERFNGTGYPRGRSGAQLHPMAKIASLADVYVAMTSHRPHRVALTPYKAIEVLLRQAREGLFDPQTLRGLLQTVSLFPLGSIVLLSNDTYARVLRNSPEAYDRPTVQVICRVDGGIASESIVNLASYDLLRIVRAIDEREVAPFELTLMSTLHRLESESVAVADNEDLEWSAWESSDESYASKSVNMA
ncbi:HD-GYP domain-containing protein [Lacunimicrobium album]